MPMRALRNRASASSPSAVRSCPATRTSPELGRSKPAMTIIMVDLPEPEGPATPTVSPRATARFRPRRILTSPAALASFRWTSLSRIIAASSAEAVAMRLRVPLASRLVHAALGALLLHLATPALPAASGGPLKILALGDSLTAGYGLPANDGFTAQLGRALKGAGIHARIIDGGVSGDPVAGGLARLA